jgi:hypothetical protein
MKSLFFITIILFLFSCGKELPGGVAETSPEFYEFIDDFMADANTYNVNADVDRIIVTFGDIHSSQGIVGSCDTFTGIVTVDSSYWAVSNSYSRKALIYHELAKCLLGKSHIDDSFIGVPISLMNSKTIHPEHLEKYFDLYVIELFNNDSVPLTTEIAKSFTYYTDFSSNSWGSYIAFDL